MATAPRVTVLMALYNGESFLREAMDSILAQTFADFEFLIIDDGSIDKSAGIVATYCDPRIRLFHNGSNLGLVTTHNRGLALARGEFIARMDSDDISLPERLSEQVAFMDKHPEVGVCGTWIGALGEDRVWWAPTADSKQLHCLLLFNSVVAHPTAIYRRKLMTQDHLYYREGFQVAEDYDFWVRVSRHCALANLQKVLLLYRRHPSQVTQVCAEELRTCTERIRREQIEHLGVSLSPEELSLHHSISGWDLSRSKTFVRDAGVWLAKLVKANEQAGVYPKHAFERMLGERWLAICSFAANLGFWTWQEFWKSPLSRIASRKQQLRLLVKCGYYSAVLQK